MGHPRKRRDVFGPHVALELLSAFNEVWERFADPVAGPRALAPIVSRFALCGLDQTLQAAMLRAIEGFWGWRAQRRDKAAGLGGREDVNALVSALKKASGLLKKQSIFNRLAVALSEIPADERPYRTGDTVHSLFAARIFDSPSRAAAAVNGLLQLAEQARFVNGRRANGLRRSDLRAAALPLRQFWSEGAGRAAYLGQRGGIFSPEVEFLHACLCLIDPDVTKRLIADFDT
jgi:hypothetical protein